MIHHCKECGAELTKIPGSCTCDNWQCQKCFYKNLRFERPMLNNKRLLPAACNDGYINHERYGKSRRVA